MCDKAVQFTSPQDNLPRSEDQPTKYWYRKSMEQRTGIDETRKQLIESAWEAVLDAQVDQWAAGESDPEQLAKVYRQVSSSSQVKAIVDGLKVQEEAALCTTE